MPAPADPHRPAPVDLTDHPYLTGVFAPQRHEVDVADLPVHGAIPGDLRGSYLRNGPNPRFDPIGSFVYPLDGDGMVHRLTLADGSAAYRNRFVRTPMVELKSSAAKPCGPASPTATRPGVGGGRGARRHHSPAARHQHRSACRQADGDGGGRQTVPARPSEPGHAVARRLRRSDADRQHRASQDRPRTGELMLFNYALEAPYLTWSVVAPDGRATRPPTPADGVDAPMMIHDMALTATYVVLFVNLLVFDIAGRAPPR